MLFVELFFLYLLRFFLTCFVKQTPESGAMSPDRGNAAVPGRGVKRCSGAYTEHHSRLFPAAFVFEHSVTIKPLPEVLILSCLTTPLGLFLNREKLKGVFQG